MTALPPTSDALLLDDERPYFLWWTSLTVAGLREQLASPDRATRAYYLGALLREANSRDVWLFTTPAVIREHWPDLLRHLGRARPMWAWLMGMAPAQWPPAEARRGQRTEQVSFAAPCRRRAANRRAARLGPIRPGPCR